MWFQTNLQGVAACCPSITVSYRLRWERARSDREQRTAAPLTYCFSPQPDVGLAPEQGLLRAHVRPLTHPPAWLQPSTRAPARVRRSKSIGECKSKQEEDKILQHEVGVLKQRFTEQLAPKKMKEAIVRMMYAEMLGHDAYATQGSN